jgi:hypothetical protein
MDATMNRRLALAAVFVGALIVGHYISAPSPEWRAIKADDNPAVADDGNPKKAQVGEHDKLFGAVVSSPVTIVEFRYPENGSYTFNFLPAKGARREYGENLKTELVLVGSGSQVPDPETLELVEWPSLDTVAVLGSKRDQAWSRLAKATFTRALDKGMTIGHFQGVRTMAMTPDQIAEHVVNPN